MDIENKRVKYIKSSLAEVIYQLRYPTILNISASDPVAFQERVRAEFPYYRKIVNNNEIEINGVKQSLGSEINYEFISQDKGTKINLTSSFLAISSRKYDRWEFFRDLVEKIRLYFEEVYHPPFYIRLGLRYQNVIDREKLGLKGRGWVELIRPHILGTISEENQDSMRQWIVNSEFIDRQSGIQTRQVFQLSQKVGVPDMVMVLDCDYFIVKNISSEEVLPESNQLHEESSSFIRKAITHELHIAMEPIDL